VPIPDKSTVVPGPSLAAMRTILSFSLRGDTRLSAARDTLIPIERCRLDEDMPK